MSLYQLTIEPGTRFETLVRTGHFIPAAHRRILINLFELEDVTVEDVMTPRNQIEAIDLEQPLPDIQHQIATSHHGRVPVYVGELDRVLGVLPQRRVVSALSAGELDQDEIRGLLTRPYFVPSATPLYSQLQFFQENRQRLALVVNEYGEVEGLVTLEDIIEEIVGKFTTGVPGSGQSLSWNGDNSVIVDGGRSLRELNGKLGLTLPLDGPKTLNGLLLERGRLAVDGPALGGLGNASALAVHGHGPGPHAVAQQCGAYAGVAGVFHQHLVAHVQQQPRDQVDALL